MTFRVSLSDPRPIFNRGTCLFAGACHVLSFSTLFSCPYSPIVRQVKPNEGEDLAKVNKAAWVETSAKNDVNVGECSSGSSVSYLTSFLLKARCLSCVWRKSKSVPLPVPAKHQPTTSVLLCDIQL